MNTVRFIFDIPPATVSIPEYLRHHPVEVLIVPLEEREPTGPVVPNARLARFSGAWKGEPMVREDPGTYETREEVDSLLQ